MNWKVNKPCMHFLEHLAKDLAISYLTLCIKGSEYEEKCFNRCTVSRWFFSEAMGFFNKSPVTDIRYFSTNY